MNPYLPDVISSFYRGTLLSRILAMPKANPISFEAAASLASDKSMEAFQAGLTGYEPGKCGWYYQNFIEWITSLGYHIEITGDEFESYAMTDKLA